MELEHKPDIADVVNAGAASVSPLDELRQVYNAIDDDEVQTEVFDIPGCNVAVRYRRLAHDTRTKIFAGDGSLWELNAQFLIDACDEILFRNPGVKPGPDGDANLEPLVAGARVTFDLRPNESIPLHKALGEHETDARRSVLRLFQGVDDELMRHADEVGGWMSRVSARAARAFAGG